MILLLLQVRGETPSPVLSLGNSTVETVGGRVLTNVIGNSSTKIAPAFSLSMEYFLAKKVSILLGA